MVARRVVDVVSWRLVDDWLGGPLMWRLVGRMRSPLLGQLNSWLGGW